MQSARLTFPLLRLQTDVHDRILGRAYWIEVANRIQRVNPLMATAKLQNIIATITE